jgi:hypothetical protein
MQHKISALSQYSLMERIFIVHITYYFQLDFCQYKMSLADTNMSWQLLFMATHFSPVMASDV